jgi:hypothetical protein
MKPKIGMTSSWLPVVLPLRVAYKGDQENQEARDSLQFQLSDEAPCLTEFSINTASVLIEGRWPGLALWTSCARNYALFADAGKPSLNPLSPKPGHHAASAKSVIWLFMEGGPSHLDLFDPKPTLEKLAGQPMPASFGRPITAMGTGANALMPSQRTFKQYGQSGTWVSD